MLIKQWNKLPNKLLKVAAFTLAEVLIVLGIVGIIAEMTIPTLISNFQNQAYVALFKKAYTESNQVLLKMCSDANCLGDLKCTGLMGSGTTDKTFGDEFSKYFKVARNCGTLSDTGITNCFPDTVYVRYDHASPNTGWDGWWYRFITADGMSFMIHNFGNNCADGGFSANVTNDLTQVCGQALIDTNGLKGPNSAGRDIFQFYISNGRGPLFYPMGGLDDGTGWKHWKNASGTPTSCDPTVPYGLTCAGRIMEESWQMNY